MSFDKFGKILSHSFFEYFFSPVLFTASFWDSNDMHINSPIVVFVSKYNFLINSPVIVSQVPEALPAYFFQSILSLLFRLAIHSIDMSSHSPSLSYLHSTVECIQGVVFVEKQ